MIRHTSPVKRHNPIVEIKLICPKIRHWLFDFGTFFPAWTNLDYKSARTICGGMGCPDWE
jgi:hypothetical protein